jgi:hypothetical protein
MDMCGFPKDLFYYYQANWTLKPVLHLFPHWNWSTPGQAVNVWVFGNCDTVELFTNGVSLGRKNLNVQSHAEWDNVPYAAGTLRAIGYRNTQPVMTNTVETTGTPAAIALWPDRNTILADGRDVSVVTVAVLDSLGRVVPIASNLVNFAISGGAIIGVGNGNPSSHEPDKTNQWQRQVFSGLAQVIVQSTNQPGSITLTATSTGLTLTNITITEAATLPAPPAPTGVAAVGGNAQVMVSWDIVPGTTTYNLWRATTSGGSYTLIAGNIGGINLGYTDNNVTNLTTYYYVVTANGNGTSLNSAEVSATPSAIVSGLTANVVNSQVQLQWNASTGVTGYNVKRSLISGGPYTTIAASLSTTNYTDATVSSCQTYYYVVTITNAGNESLPSAEVSATSPGVLPPQFINADIGAVGLAGSASFCGGQFIVSGSGADIWGTADAFQFVYVYVPISTNCDIRARVVGISNSDGWAKAGVMIRESLAAGSRNAYMAISYANGATYQYRNATSGSTANSTGTGTAPYWVRVTRTNNVFQAYRSSDGTSWNAVGSATVIPMAGTGAYVGLAVTAHNSGLLNSSVFDNVSANFLTNAPPVISWVVPANNSTFIQPKTITLTASATDGDGTVTNVAFFNGTTLLGNAPNGVGTQYSLTWSNAAVGSYTLSACATDNSGATNISPATIAIVVQPLTLTVSGSQASGQFRLTFPGQNGQSYVLETSTNLTDWTPVWTNAPANGLLMFTNINATDRARFYRVRQ